VDSILELNRQVPKLEAELTDFPGTVSRLGIPLVPLSASGGLVAVKLPPVQGIPKLALDGNRVSLGSRSTIEATDSRYARYLWLYLSALKDGLRGKTPSEIVELIKVPNSSEALGTALAKRASVEDQPADLRSRRFEVDKEIDLTTNELYLGTREALPNLD
jgi:hypothetical protein